MRSQYKPRIILSVENNKLTDIENANRKHQFQLSLNHLKIKSKQVLGVYNGIKENSIMLDDNEENRALAIQAMDFFEQDAILLITNEGRGHLLLSNLKETNLGNMKVSQIKPTQGDYSYVPSSTQYITFRG